VVNVSEFLLERQLVSAADLMRAEQVAQQSSRRLPATLAGLGMVAETDLIDAFVDAMGYSVASRDDLAGSRVDIDGINSQFLSRHNVVPLSFEDGTLKLAMADPSDASAIAGMAFATGARQIVPLIAGFSDINDAIVTYRKDASDFDSEFDFGDSGTSDDFERLVDGASDAPIIRLVQRLLASAVNRRASDVHIEPMARYVSVRYRIDGRLSEVERHPDSIAGPVASRIKVMAGLDIAESRLPQDGRLRLTVRGRDVDVRVSTSPIANGESIVLRLLGRSEVPLDLEQLGLPQAALLKLLAALERPHGIILLTGPTGSGKTTTLYAAISRLRRPEVKILTVEDPVEVLLDGVNQVQVRPDIDLSYAATLRAFLRQDPDILMIGEIRDQETAEIAMRAALTGHLVLSTLHTNSALGAFTRLADIGIEPYLAASTVIATIAQRLIRSLCAECREARVPSEDEHAAFFCVDVAVPKTVYDPGGCGQCSQTGFRGRVPLIEILEVDDALRAAIRLGDTEQWARKSAPSETLFGHGLALVAAGRTTLVEVRRAVQLN
jgi:general secretion pathway protein E